jgi:hypothetical protein
MKKKLSNKVLFMLLIIVLTFLVLLLIFYEGKLFPNEDVYVKNITRPLKNLEASNGMVTNIWFRDESKLDRFVKNDMKYLFVDVGDIEKNGILITSEEELRSFIDFIEDYEERKNFDFVLLPYNEIILNNYDFSSLVFRNNIIKNHLELIEFGFDGAYLDIEAIPFNERGNFLNFLEEIGGQIGNERLLTTYSGAIDKTPNVWEWEPEFYSAVSDRVDIITTQSYDFGLITKEDYQEYLSGQLKELANREWNSKIFFTAPTHKSPPETFENALEVYARETELNMNNKFMGVTIFAEWTTDDNEWNLIEFYI